MSHYTAQMTPRCFGRYLIDLPADMKPADTAAVTLTMSPYSERSGGIHVNVTPMPKSSFDRMLARREKTLESQHIAGHPGQAYLDEAVPVIDGSGVIFNRSENGASRGSRILELHGWKNHYAIKMTIRANDVDYPEYADDKQLQALGSTVHTKLNILQSLYKRIRGRQNNEIPPGPGACIQNGFISSKSSEKLREDIMMGFVSKTMPDVRIHIEYDSGLRTETELLDRIPEIEKMLKAANGHIVRKGHARSKVGLAFEEVLSTGMTPDNQVIGQYFTLEANSKIGSAQTPLLIIDFWNGNRENKSHHTSLPNASLSEAESLALWDEIAATLRARPAAF